MVKIIIYEDGDEDLIDRYSHLTKEYDIHVRYTSTAFWNIERFRRNGFNPDNFIDIGEISEKEDADIYFLDGLGGHCFNVIKFKNLPKERVFINTNSKYVNENAKRMGFNIVGNRRVEDIVKLVVEQIREGKK